MDILIIERNVLETFPPETDSIEGATNTGGCSLMILEGRERREEGKPLLLVETGSEGGRVTQLGRRE